MKLLFLLILVPVVFATRICWTYDEDYYYYEITKLLGYCRDGTVFKAVGDDGIDVAIKVTINHSQAKNEWMIYQELGALAKYGSRTCDAKKGGLLCVYQRGVVKSLMIHPDDRIDYSSVKPEMFILVMELAGENLYSARTHKAFSKEKWLNAGSQMHNCLAYLHKRNVVHGNIEPENFVFSLDKDPMVLLIGFSNASIGPFLFTGYLKSRYTKSLHIHTVERNTDKRKLTYKTYSMKDDLESYVYCFYVLGMQMPWNIIETFCQRNEQLVRMNRRIPDHYGCDIDQMIQLKEGFPETIRKWEGKLTKSLTTLMYNIIVCCRSPHGTLQETVHKENEFQNCWEQELKEESTKIKTTGSISRWKNPFKIFAPNRREVAA